MTEHLPETTYALLGLIDKLPTSSGHELATAAERSFAHFWPISRTLLYRELNRLVDLGWVSTERVEQMRLPSKWTYDVTTDGQRALADWLSRPAAPLGTFRSEFLLRFFFAHRLDRLQVHALLESYRASLMAQQDEFATLEDKLASTPGPAARIGRLSALHGLRTAQARLDWVDEARGALDTAEEL